MSDSGPVSAHTADILAVVLPLSVTAQSADGQANHLTQLVPILASKLDGHLHVVALRVGEQSALPARAKDGR